MAERGSGADGARRRRPRDAAELHDQIRATRSELREQVRERRAEFDQANARVTARMGRNLLFAVVVGLGLGGAFLAAVLVAKPLFLIVAGVLVGFSAAELPGALRTAGRDVPRVGSTVIGVLALPVAYLFPINGWLWVVVAAVAAAVLWRLVGTFGSPVPGRALLPDLAATVFVQLYITLLATCAVVLTARPDGQWWTLTFISVVVAGDIFAYFSGLAFGKHPMAPRISPKKTWEGFAGAVLAANVVAVFLVTLLLHESFWFGLLFGTVILLTGTLGDLTESMIKRDIGVKDISSALPGHGGVLDRMDSILPSAAAALLLFLLVH